MSTEKNIFAYVSWLGSILFLWVKSLLIPKEKGSAKSKVVEKGSSVCYLLRTRSISDLLVLDHHCKKEGLPRPVFHKRVACKKAGSAFYVYLKRLGMVSSKPSKGIPAPLLWASNAVSENLAGPDVRIVPVSVYWGRQPTREDPSLLKLLFFAPEHGGYWQRLMAILFHGRQVVCSLGEPISTKQTLKICPNAEQAARRINRLVKLHFHRDRQKVVGPQVYDLGQVMEQVIRTPSVKQAIAETARKKKAKPEKYEAKARKYFKEIAAKQSHSTIRIWARFLKWLWQKVYEGVEIKSLDKVQQIPGNHEVVFLPCHKSHIDYLLLAYILFGNGFRTPHTAAGVNLNFWPAGPLLRKGGAFYLRRTFRGNRVYQEVFHEYVCYLIEKGFPMQLFIEGGRSRTGRLLRPKTGMLSMVVEGQRRVPQKKVTLVPTYIGYERVIEASSYQRELGGKKKASESIKQLFGAVKILRKKHGKVFVNFGEPIDLHQYLDQKDVLVKETTEHGKEEKPAHFVTAVNELAVQIMEKIGKNTVVSDAAIFSSLLLSTPNNALAEDQLLRLAGLVQSLVSRFRSYDQEPLSESALKKDLVRIEKLLDWQRFSNPAGDVVYAEQSHVFHLTYYRNNIAHFLLLPGALAQLAHLNSSVRRKDALEVLGVLFEVYRKDLFLEQNPTLSMSNSEDLIQAFVDHRLIRQDIDLLKQPEIGEDSFYDIKAISRLTEPFVEPIAMAFYFLGVLIGKTVVKKSFEDCLQVFRQRMLILNGGDSVTAFYQEPLKLLLGYLLKQELVESKDEHRLLLVTQKIEHHANLMGLLLSEEQRMSLVKVAQKVELSD